MVEEREKTEEDLLINTTVKLNDLHTFGDKFIMLKNSKIIYNKVGFPIDIEGVLLFIGDKITDEANKLSEGCEGVVVVPPIINGSTYYHTK